jgi:glycosyltransferase involved in cell wall biosynthesis
MGIEVLYGPNYADNWRHWIKDNHEKIDFVLLNRPHIAIKYIDFVRKNTKARILYYGHDLHFIREQKQYEIEKDPNLLKSLQEWKKKETYIFSQSDLILTPSDEEKQAIDNIIGTNDKTKTILPYFFENFPNPITDFSKRSNILFVGGFTHKPNVDAVLWFHNEIWPSIKKEIPDAKFIVVGSNTPDQIFHIASQDVVIKGHLRQDELEAIYSSVKIIAIPLRYGAGVKGKTVEAMHKGVPLVSTSFGVEGLPGDFSFLQVTDDPKEFAERICKLYASAANLMEQSTKSINYIRDNFSEEKARMVFKDILEIP